MQTPSKQRGALSSGGPFLLVGTLLFLSFVCIVFFSLMPAPENPFHPKLARTTVAVAEEDNNFVLSDQEYMIPWWGGNVVIPKPLQLDAENYPVYADLLKVVQDWNPDFPDPPKIFRETLQHFNYSNKAERAMAEEYRNAELPFKVYNVPEFERTKAKWTDEYLSNEFRKMGSVHVERSVNNHFMYWTMKGGRDPHGYVPPTEIIHSMTFDEWVELANEADRTKLMNSTEHFYLMSSSAPGDHGRSFIARDLKKFSTETPNFFIPNPKGNKGIQCRLAMRGVISEAHYDSGRNMVLMLKGVKRYILNPPHACKNLALIKDVDHPSYRHSIIDWSDPGQAVASGFGGVDSIDTLVREGEVLYIPSYWNHYIIALRYSTQCNSRSGSPPNGEGLSEIEECMGRLRSGGPKSKPRKQMRGAA